MSRLLERESEVGGSQVMPPVGGGGELDKGCMCGGSVVKQELELRGAKE